MFLKHFLITLKYKKTNMQTYCVKYKRNTGNKDTKVIKTKNSRLQMKSHCSVWGHKKSRFISKNEGSGILSSLDIRTPLSKIPGLNILF